MKSERLSIDSMVGLSPGPASSVRGAISSLERNVLVHTVFDTRWRQGGTITQDDALKQESVAREVVLCSEIYFVCTLFQSLNKSR